MPRTEEENKRIRDKRKAQIMQVALEEFANNGYHRTSMSRIAGKCDISKGSLYNYFEGKDDLLHSLIDQVMHEGDEVMDILDRDEKEPFEKLMMACKSAFDMVEHAPEYWRFILMLSLQKDVIDKVKDKVIRNNEVSILKTEKLLHELGCEQAREEAYLLGSILDGLLLHKTSLSKDYPFGKMRAYFFEFIKNRYQ